LPAVIPEEARSFRVHDPELAATLIAAGASVVEGPADVEIGAAEQLSAGSGHLIVTIAATRHEGGPLPLRVARRLVGSLRARLRARRARRRLAALGCPRTTTILWDVEQPIRLPSVRRGLRGHRVVELLPTRALVIGRRDRTWTPLLDAVTAKAGAAIGHPIPIRSPLVRAGLTVVLSDAYVVRVAVGQGRRRIEMLRSGLQRLAAGKPPPIVADTVPWILAEGRLDLADWTVERRLTGTSAPTRLTQSLLDSCVDFLVALHRCGSDSARPSIIDDSEVVAAVCPRPAHGDVIRELGRRLQARLADLPRGFGHGDFWTPNLLVRDGRLSGVIDWDAAAPDRLPAIDLLHLLFSARRQRTREYIGVGLVGHHLPWARAGGSRVLHSYCGKLGLELDREQLEALVLAYWLDRVSFELRMFADRTKRPVWMRNNILSVLESVPAGAWQAV
jgi:hypothetical protein